MEKYLFLVICLIEVKIVDNFKENENCRKELSFSRTLGIFVFCDSGEE